jgi:hypothetical protein
VCGRLLRQSPIGMYKAKERDLSFTLAVLPGAFGFELGQNEAMSAARISGAGPHPGPEADPCDRNSRVAKFNDSSWDIRSAGVERTQRDDVKTAAPWVIRNESLTLLLDKSRTAE